MNAPLSTWELFRAELARNVRPDRRAISNSLHFLRPLCPGDTLQQIINVRYMAAYEETVAKHLHVDCAWKAAHIKAEFLHLGTCFEGVLEVVALALYDHGKFTPGTNTSKLASFRAGGPHPSFYMLIKTLRFEASQGQNRRFSPETLSVADELRRERNKVHVYNIIPTADDQRIHEEFRLARARARWPILLSEAKACLQAERLI